MTIKKIIDKGLCLGCGICTYDSKVEDMIYSGKMGMFIPDIKDNKNYDIADIICPGKGYKIVDDGDKYFGNSDYSIELGHVDKSFVAYSKNKEILSKASSGGLMTEIILFLLQQKIVDRVGVTKFVYTEKGPRTYTFLTNDVNEIINSQGSKYCPVDISNFIKECKEFDGTIAYVGTPCQIAGIREIQKLDASFDAKIKITIANFCGGYKNYNNMVKLAKRHKINYNHIKYFRFRGGGQPGSLYIKDDKNTYEVPYPKYGGYTGYSKILRCHLCVDATGELADIACGDAWLERFINDENPWSIILTRSTFASNIIKDMKLKNLIYVESISKKDVCHSQSENLISKKIRQAARLSLYKLLKYNLPKFDGGYNLEVTSLRTEVIVYFTHKFKNLIEKMGFYPIYRRIIRKKY